MRTRQKKESDINKDDINKDETLNIRDIVDNSFIKDYLKYVEYLERNEWTRESIKIYEYLTALVTINTLNVGNEGIIIDITCPPGRIMSIMGKNIMLESSYPHSIDNIHPFELKLANSDGVEISPSTEIKIFKDTIFKKRMEICSTLYRDVSMLNYSGTPNLFKRHNELYRFDQGLELKGEDHLRMYVVSPDVDIKIVKFNLSVDLWTQYEENIMR